MADGSSKSSVCCAAETSKVRILSLVGVSEEAYLDVACCKFPHAAPGSMLLGDASAVSYWNLLADSNIGK